MANRATRTTCYESLARTATPTPMSGRTNNDRARGLFVVIDTTAVTSTPSTTFKIQNQCPLSGQWITLLTSAAITGTGTVTLRVYPGLTPAANLTVSDVIGEVWRVLPEHGNSNSHTYSVSAQNLY